MCEEYRSDFSSVRLIAWVVEGLSFFLVAAVWGSTRNLVRPLLMCEEYHLDSNRVLD